MKVVVKIVLLALVIFAISNYGLIPGISVSRFTVALLVALALALINFFIKPVLVILTLPLNILTLGLFTFVINGFLLWLTAFLVEGFEVQGFVAAFLGAILIAAAGFIIDRVTK